VEKLTFLGALWAKMQIDINMIHFCELYTKKCLAEAAQLRKLRDVKLISKFTVKMSDLKHSHLTESIKKALKDTSYT